MNSASSLMRSTLTLEAQIEQQIHSDGIFSGDLHHTAYIGDARTHTNHHPLFAAQPMLCTLFPHAPPPSPVAISMA
ncbi:hypothetical protein NHJ13051_002095 [Beauveria bassiana]